MIGDRLHELRTDSGMTLSAFGALVGTTKQYVSQLEKGKNTKPNSEYVEGWARYFKVSMRWLVTGAGPKHATQSGADSKLIDRYLVERVARNLQTTYGQEGLTYDFMEDWQLFADLYDDAVQGKLKSTGGEVKIGRWIERKALQGTRSDNGRVGLPAPGTHPRKKGVQGKG